jgi:hypothetical protein
MKDLYVPYTFGSICYLDLKLFFFIPLCPLLATYVSFSKLFISFNLCLINLNMIVLAEISRSTLVSKCQCQGPKVDKFMD